MKISAKQFAVGMAMFLCLIFMAQKGFSQCSVSASGINFGSYDVFSSTPTDSTGTIKVTCNENNATIVTIAIGTSSNSGGFNPRQMKNVTGSDLLNYNLFTRSNMNRVWGDGNVGTRTLSHGVQKNKPWSATVYARIYAGQDVSVGSYTDIITVTITW